MLNHRPFNIRIFVAEGIPDGLRLVEKSNWVGLGIVCPRARYAQARERDEFERSGVYVLIGDSETDGQPRLYVGEGETVRNRLDSHHINKDFWQRAVVFSTKGDPLNKAEVQYLEASLVELAMATKRCKLDNGNVPKKPTLSEPDQAQVEGYLAEMLSLMPVLGIDAFEMADTPSDEQLIYHFDGTGWSGTGFESASGFVVQKGSLARLDTLPSLSSYQNSREPLLQAGVLVREADGLRFTSDHEFSSPSEAGTVLSGHNTNGRIAWKDADGVTLKEHQAREASN